MWLVRAERQWPTRLPLWFGFSEYIHGHRASDSLQAVARHWLLSETSRLFTGTEDEPDRHGPFAASPDLWKRFRECAPIDVMTAVSSWGSDADRFAETTTAAADVQAWATSLFSRSVPERCLLIVATDEELAAQSAGGSIGAYGGFIQALWIRPDDNRLLILICSDD